MSNFLAFDTETHLIRPGSPAPKVVCLSLAVDTSSAELIHRRDPAFRRTVVGMFEGALAGKWLLLGQNIAFDMAVLVEEFPDLLSLVFELYEKEVVRDTRLRQQLIDNAAGMLGFWWDGSKLLKNTYNLETLAKLHHYPIPLDKDTWRLRYSEFDEVPIDQWPEGAQEYPKHDAKSTLWVGKEQETSSRFLSNEPFQCYAAWALHLVSCWGMVTEEKMVRRYKERTLARLAHYEAQLRAADLVYDKKDGPHKRTKKAQEYALKVAEQLSIPCSLTDTGKPCLDEEAVELLADPLLIAFQQWGSSQTVLSRVEELEKGLNAPIHTRWDTLLATGRVSSSNPNLTNRPNQPGDRESFIPRKGNVFIDIDFDMLELHGWAQACIKLVGGSDMADALNAGRDPHSDVAATILGISREEAAKRKKVKGDKEFQDSRQAGKVCNFGLPGGMGVDTFVASAWAMYKVRLTREKATFLKNTWKQTWREARPYFSHMARLVGDSTGTIETIFTGRVRGKVNYCAACNTPFQALGADCAKAGLIAIVKACYLGELRGCRVTNFVHDQILAEAPESCAEDAARIIQRFWCEEGSRFVPDCPNTATPILCRRWSKLAGDEKAAAPGWEKGTPWEWAGAVD